MYKNVKINTRSPRYLVYLISTVFSETTNPPTLLHHLIVFFISSVLSLSEPVFVAGSFKNMVKLHNAKNCFLTIHVLRVIL